MNSRSLFTFGAILSVFMIAVPTWSKSKASKTNVSLESVYEVPSTPQRLLRGDFEAPDYLMLAYYFEWTDALEQIIMSARDDADILLLLPTDESREEVESWLQDRELYTTNLTLLDKTVDTPWVRDYGPMQVRDKDGQSIWLDATYDSHRPNDDLIPSRIGLEVGAQVESVPIAFEGGAIISNGAGLCIVTSDSMQHGNIDPKDSILMDSFLSQMGCHVLALVPPLLEEPTGHVDIFAQFLSPTHIAVASVDPIESFEDAIRLKEAVKTITYAAGLLDLTLEITRIHMPVQGHIYFSYLNAVRLRNGLLVPSYNRISSEIQSLIYSDLQAVLGEIPLIPIDADTMIDLEGALHCIAVGLDKSNINKHFLSHPFPTPNLPPLGLTEPSET